MTVHNYWTDQTRIKEAVVLLQSLLTAEFESGPPEPMDWLAMVEELIDTLYSNDIVVLDGLMRYEIECSIDAYGLVEKIKLIEKNG